MNTNFVFNRVQRQFLGFSKVLVVSLVILVLLVGVVPVASQSDPNVYIYTTPDWLILRIVSPQPISLSGLGLRVLIEGKPTTKYPVEQFAILKLSEGMALPGWCFVYQVADSEALPPSACIASNLVRVFLAPPDVFWYDKTLYTNGSE